MKAMPRTARNATTAKPSGQTVFLAAVVVCSALVIGYLLYADQGVADVRVAGQSSLTLADIPFNGQRAFKYLEELCALGPRPSGSQAMQAQQKMLAEHFRKLGGQVEFQKFRIRHPVDGSEVPMANLVVRWHPERKERMLLAAHYDTRPFPDEDRVNPQGTFLGANDAGSGVALLMELAHDMPKLKGRLGVDFALFDGEEFIFDKRGDYFCGSEWFAQQYVASKDGPRYKGAVVLDMVGDADLQLYQERFSISWPDTRPLVQAIWGTARRLGVREFIASPGYEIRDDHLPLHETAHIPACDVIDFLFPHWHTEGDKPENCSALSLAKVGWVIREWLTAAVKKG